MLFGVPETTGRCLPRHSKQPPDSPDTTWHWSPNNRPFLVNFLSCIRRDYRLSYALRRRSITMPRPLPSSTSDAGSGTGGAAVNSAHTAMG